MSNLKKGQKETAKKLKIDKKRIFKLLDTLKKTRKKMFNCIKIEMYWSLESFWAIGIYSIPNEYNEKKQCVKHCLSNQNNQ